MAHPNSMFVCLGIHLSKAAARDHHRVVEELYTDPVIEVV
jgi:hypothetical protein